MTEKPLLFFEIPLAFVHLFDARLKTSESPTLSLPFLPPKIYICLSVATHPNLDRFELRGHTSSQLKENKLSFTILFAYSLNPPIR